MHAAVKGDADTVKLLLAKGADPTPKNADGKSAAEVAIEYKHKKVLKMIQNTYRPTNK
jgi:ankyrin repeat protein